MESPVSKRQRMRRSASGVPEAEYSLAAQQQHSEEIEKVQYDIEAHISPVVESTEEQRPVQQVSPNYDLRVVGSNRPRRESSDGSDRKYRL